MVGPVIVASFHAIAGNVHPASHYGDGTNYALYAPLVHVLPTMQPIEPLPDFASVLAGRQGPDPALHPTLMSR